MLSETIVHNYLIYTNTVYYYARYLYDELSFTYLLITILLDFSGFIDHA